MTDKFAVIDTETNWNDQVMSIGVVVADLDAEDELQIMQLLGHGISEYAVALI